MRTQQATAWLRWIPRLLAIAYLIFISLFALDIFDLDLSFWEMSLGLLMHLIPSFVALAVLILSWRFELAGGIIFVLLGLLFPMVFRDASWQSWLFLLAPLWLIGFLFIASAWKSKALGKNESLPSN
jgi:hypothetical protein